MLSLKEGAPMAPVPGFSLQQMFSLLGKRRISSLLLLWSNCAGSPCVPVCLKMVCDWAQPHLGLPPLAPQQPPAAFREWQGCKGPQVIYLGNPGPSGLGKALCLPRIPSWPVTEPNGDSKRSLNPHSRGLLLSQLSG